MTINHAPYASQAIVNSAISAGITAEVIAKSRGSHRRHHANGSTAVPQKVVLLNGIRMSLGQARQYVEARQHVEWQVGYDSDNSPAFGLDMFDEESEAEAHALELNAKGETGISLTKLVNSGPAEMWKLVDGEWN